MRAISTTDGDNEETARTEPGITVNVPSEEDACSAHLVNSGIQVNGTNATVEFGGVRANGFTCRHMGREDQPQSCVFIAG